MPCLTPNPILKSHAGKIDASDFSETEIYLQRGEYLYAKQRYLLLRDIASSSGNENTFAITEVGIARAELHMGNTAEATRLSTPLVSGGIDEATSIFQRANQILQITYNRIAQAHTKKTSQNSPFAESAIQRAELGIQLARFSGNVADELDLQTNLLMSLSLRAPHSGGPGVDLHELIAEAVELHGLARAHTAWINCNSLMRLIMVGGWAGQIGLSFGAFKKMNISPAFQHGRQVMLNQDRLHLEPCKTWYDVFYRASNGSRVRSGDKARALYAGAGFLMREFAEELRPMVRDYLSEMAFWCYSNALQSPGLAQSLRNRITDLQIHTGERAVLHLHRA
jgi:hypothetical protein